MKSKGLGDDIAKITSATKLDKLAERSMKLLLAIKTAGAARDKIN
jgi:hypothetical protein